MSSPPGKASPTAVCRETGCGHPRHQHKRYYGTTNCDGCVRDASAGPAHEFTIEPPAAPGQPGAVW